MAKTRKTARRSVRSRRARTPAARPANSSPENPAALDVTSLSAPLDVIAKSFAVVAMRLALGRPADGERKQVGPRAQFLKGLGLETGEIAQLLGSTPESISELVSRAQRTRRKSRKRRRGRQ